MHISREPLDNRRSPTSEVEQVFSLIWDDAPLSVRWLADVVAVEVKTERFVHTVMLPPCLALEGAGLALVRQLFHQHVPERMRDATRGEVICVGLASPFA